MPHLFRISSYAYAQDFPTQPSHYFPIAVTVATIDTSHYLPDYLHLIIQGCHYLPIHALITGSASSSNCIHTCAYHSYTMCHMRNFTVFSINALEFVLKPELTIAESASEVAGRNYQQVPLYSCLPMIKLINLIRIKPDDCHRLISIWLFDCNLPCALSMQRALWALRQILPLVWLSDCIDIISSWILVLVLKEGSIRQDAP